MKKIILDLYNGNYSAFERRFAPNCEQTKALNRVVELEEEVQKTIPAEYQPLIKAYGDALSDLSSISCQDDFLEGYRLGVRLMLAAWPENAEEIPIPEEG